MSNLRNGRKGDSNPGSPDCESGILPLSCRIDNEHVLVCHTEEAVFATPLYMVVRSSQQTWFS